ncbi:MAG: translation initiation factor [Campylobacterota bacterium]|nr:translation initiation factor [Campylobacterota bacterium]
MNKVKISEVAQETAKNPKEVLSACEILNISAKAASSSISLADAEKLMSFLISGAVPAKKEAPVVKKEIKLEKKDTTQEKATLKKTPQVQNQDTEEESKDVDLAEKKDSEPMDLAKKGTGLRIVKKKRTITPETIRSKIAAIEDKEEDFPVKIYGKKRVASDVADIEDKKKKNKKHHASIMEKKEVAIKIDVLSNRNLSDSFYDDFDDEVMLPDLTVSLMPEEPRDYFKKDTEALNIVNKKANAKFNTQVSISRNTRKKRRPKIEKEEGNETISSVEITEGTRIYEFAEKIKKPINEVIKALFSLGMMVTKNDFMDKDTIEVLAEEFGVEVHIKNELDSLDYVGEYNEKSDEYTEERPPIVTIMGHVDHGKTSLLDYIKKTKVAAGEAGGITQHVGAYTVKKNGKEITFIDTPGHEAFTEMRARGANVTDIVIIVVAADDGVMPQTVEAINHAKAAKAPIIVAINKMDKPEANPDYVKGQLAELGLTPIDWGGEYECVGVSAKTGDGVNDLLETILIQAEMMELKANSKASAKAVVIEASLEKGRGAVATVIIQNGTLKKGDSVIAGTSFGRVRAILDDMGNTINELKPSEAGQIIGLDSVPQSGDIVVVMEDEKTMRETALSRREHARQKQLSKSTKATAEDLHDLIAEGMLNKLPIVLKADVQGTLEALIASLSKMRNDEVKVNIIHSAVGAISESDVILAAASEHAIILGFHVKPSVVVKQKAKELGVDIKTYDVIYDLLEDVKKVLGGMLSPEIKEEITGHAEVREVFNVPKLGTIAGCMVTDGQIERNSLAKVLRGEEIVFAGRVISLKRFKDDVKEVKKGFECGIGIESFTGFNPGDVIETYKEVKVKAKFE